MSKKILVIGVLLSCLFISQNSFALEPFNSNVFTQIKEENLGKRWLLVLWSVDCPPCFKELALLQKLRSEKQLLPIVIINVDDNDEVAGQRVELLKRFQLNELPNYYFQDGEGDKQRYNIDSQWYGELPRSYFVEANGTFHGKSGLMSEQVLTKWLLNQP
ncbi:MAG: hypothetical protein DRQ47_07515 [Gammaproteobacteria bacterium]|nr:MAG: hypothetical protein DRQ47_07515 [Gammaproteobacteria bacterium]